MPWLAFARCTAEHYAATIYIASVTTCVGYVSPSRSHSPRDSAGLTRVGLVLVFSENHKNQYESTEEVESLALAVSAADSDPS